MTPNEALRVVAHHVAGVELEDLERRALWESYPEIGEHDWERIMALIKARGAQLRPKPDEYEAAYALLKERADGSV